MLVISRVLPNRRAMRVAMMLAVSSLLVACEEVGVAGPTQASAVAPQVVVSAEAIAPTAFPLAVKAGKRYLEDLAGRPFLLHGDTAWSLIAQLSREDAEHYLEDRRARGFNTVLVNLIEHHFSTNPPANAYGEAPFLRAGAFAEPNERYFAHADWVLQRAADKGLLVLLAPAYAGIGGGREGWYADMVASGPAKLRQYGRFLGQRYRGFSNILWLHAGDYNPPNKDLVRAIAEGIQEFDAVAVHSAHGAPETAASEYWHGEPWLHVNTAYTYAPVHIAALRQYRRPETLPFFLIESKYEDESPPSSDHRMRVQAYSALLSGAAGQVFGNNPVWHFDGPGIRPPPAPWRLALGSRGAQSMTHLRNLLAHRRWWLLEPDIADALLVGGHGSDRHRAVAATASDRSFAMVYLPSDREVTIRMDQLAGPSVTAHWFDPASGSYEAVEGSPFSASGSRRLRRERLDGSELRDRVLVLESQS